MDFTDISIDTIWSQSQALLERQMIGESISRLLIAVAIMIVALLLRRPIANLIVRIVRRWIGEGAVGKQLMVVLHPPAQMLSPIIGLIIITGMVVQSSNLKEFGHNLTRCAIVFVIFWALFRAIRPVFEGFEKRSEPFTKSMLGLSIAVSRVVVVALGAATILEVWGINIGPILAGFGLAGAAVALGAQDLFKNLIGGIFIIAEKRFQIGDTIYAEGVCTGTVETIGLRTTKLRQFDLCPIYVPNAQLSDNPVVNYRERTHRQISWVIGLTYDTTIDQLRQVRDKIEGYLQDNPEFVQPPEAAMHVRVDSFGDSAINIMVYCFTETTDWAEYLEIKERFAYEISNVVADAGSSFAFPSQSLYVENLPKGIEYFDPNKAIEHQEAGE